MSHARHLRLSLLMPALLLSACWFPKDRGQRLEERVERVEGEASLRSPGESKAAGDEQSRRIDAKLAEVQAKLNELNAAAQQARAEPPVRHDKLADEVGRLRAAVESQGHRLDTVEKSVGQLSAREGPRVVERRPAPAPAPEAPPPRKREAPPRKREEPESPPAARGQGGTGVLALARQQEASGQKAVARDLYQEYVNKFPTDPAAARAHFRLGELAFGDGRYQDAIVEYGKVAKDFPRSEDAPDALLRTADSMMRLDLKDDAAAVLSEIPKRYPSSSAAARARQRLSELTDSKGASKTRK